MCFAAETSSETPDLQPAILSPAFCLVDLLNMVKLPSDGGSLSPLLGREAQKDKWLDFNKVC